MSVLFKEHVPGHGELTVLIRQGNSIVVEAPEGLTQYDCVPFLRAIWEETLFK